MMKKWTEQAVCEEAKKYSRPSEWERHSRSSYVTAVRNKWLSKATEHMHKKKVWDKESAVLFAKKFKFKSELKNASVSCYHFLRKHGILGNLFLEKKPQKIKWTFEKVKKISETFKHKGEWQKKHRKSYDIAHRNGWIKKLCGHMTPADRPIPKWTKEAVFADALKYKTKSEWWKNSNGAHLAARKNGWFLHAVSHMKRCGNSSIQEREISSYVNKFFPDSKKIFFKNTSTNFPLARYELDVFVPDLMKGIEFDGEYWHSFEKIKQRAPNLTDEQVLSYHKDKDSFFESLNIKVLHIKEKEWKKDKQECLNKIDKFLGIL
jgi:hypothetical protein